VAVQKEVVWTNVDPQATALIVSGDNVPFLLSRPFGAGRVLCFSVAADRTWSTLPLAPLFLPLVHQIVRESAGLGRQPLYSWVTRRLELSDVLPDVSGKAQLLGPDGQVVPLRTSREEDRTVVYAEDLRTPGIYSVARGAPGATEAVLAIDADRRESDLRPLSARDLPAVAGIPNLYVAQDRDELMRRLDEHRRGRPLAEPLLWLALALALAEIFLANRAARRAAKA
jgi:hypothetical protein